MMTLAQARFGQNPVISGLMLSVASQPGLVAKELFPVLPQVLRGMTLGEVGDQALRPVDTKRAPGAVYKKVDIKWDGKTYTVDQDGIAVPMPIELLDEANRAAALSGGKFTLNTTGVAVAQLAMNTATALLDLSYELDAAAIASNVATYQGNHLALSGSSKWSDAGSDPIKAVGDAAELIRQKVGRRPNTLLLSAAVAHVVRNHPKVLSRLPNNVTQLVTDQHLAAVFNVSKVVVAESVVSDGSDTLTDIWGGDAILAFVADLSPTSMALNTPTFGVTSELSGQATAQEPYFDQTTDTWVFKAKHERKPNLVRPTAGFLFKDAV